MFDRWKKLGERLVRKADSRLSQSAGTIPPTSSFSRPTLINKEDVPQVLSILPLHNSVFFPAGVLTVALYGQESIALVKDAVRYDQLIGVLTERRAQEKYPKAQDLYSLGTVARVVKLVKYEDHYSLVVQGLTRFRLLEQVQDTPYLKVRVGVVEDETPENNVEVEALGIKLRKLAREIVEQMSDLPSAAMDLVMSITDPSDLANLLVANMDFRIDEKQAILETVDPKVRLKQVLNLLYTQWQLVNEPNRVSHESSPNSPSASRSAPAMTSTNLPLSINNQDILQALPILPLCNSVFFPAGVLPVALHRQKSVALVKDAARDNQLIGVITQRGNETDPSVQEDLYSVGTIARIVKLEMDNEDGCSLVVQGLARFRVLEVVQSNPYLEARVELVADDLFEEDVETEALRISLKKLARNMSQMMPEILAPVINLLDSTDPKDLENLLVANLELALDDKQMFLEIVNPKARLKRALELLRLKREMLVGSNRNNI